MDFENTFEVQAPVDQVWQALLDVERIAPCMPGAEVLEQTSDDAFKVGIKVKVGPVSMQYKGDVEIVERDDVAHRAVMRANAKETRGQGSATADIETQLSGNGTTSATMITHLAVRGRAAAMGKGVMQDVAAKLIKEFASNLEQMLATEEPGPAPDATAAEPATALSPPPPRPAEELRPLSIAGSVAADRLRDPRRLAITVGVVAFIAYLLRRRRH